MHITKNRLRCVLATWATAVSVGILSACKSPDADLQAGTVDPGFYKTPEAAAMQSRNARFMFHLTLVEFMLSSGMLADEFFYRPGTNDGIGTFSSLAVLDSRLLPDETMERTSIASAYSSVGSVPIGQGITDLKVLTSLYAAMHKTRNNISLARQALKTYAPESPPALQGEMAAYEAFMMVMLADFYCSGIPLSTLPLEDDFVYQPGSTTQEVYEKAVAVFDTAITLAGSDASIRHLASIGKGRALLALGRYAEAAISVQDVPIGYVFDLPAVLRWPNPTGVGSHEGKFWVEEYFLSYNTSNTEGENGINFRNSGDPRVEPLLMGTPMAAVRVPVEPTRVKVATYIEARLIQAEALAQAGDAQYLNVLNDLRANGNVTGLAPLTEPTPDAGETVLNARVDLIFEERAMWLFFTGHRQGDLRRLVRHYSRTIENTYPTGIHPVGPGYYSDFIDVPISTEELPNPLFDGCIARGA